MRFDIGQDRWQLFYYWFGVYVQILAPETITSFSDLLVTVRADLWMSAIGKHTNHRVTCKGKFDRDSWCHVFVESFSYRLPHPCLGPLLADCRLF